MFDTVVRAEIYEKIEGLIKENRQEQEIRLVSDIASRILLYWIDKEFGPISPSQAALEKATARSVWVARNLVKEVRTAITKEV